MEKIMTMYDSYKKSKRYGKISLDEFTSIGVIKEEISRLSDRKQEFEMISDSSKRMYIYIFCLSIIVGALGYKYTSTLFFPFLVLILWMMIRLFLNFSYQKATILTLATDNEIKNKNKEIIATGISLRKEAMEDFMKSQPFIN